MNPFMSRFPVESREEWFGSQQYFEELEACIEQKVNTVILGVQGSGKTSLLRTMFSFDYCERLAAERKILACEADLSAQQDGNAICHYLAERILEEAELYLEDSEKKAAMLRELRAVTGDSGQSRLSKMITRLHRKYGYFVVLLMNHFERFTTSPRVTMEHHEVLRSLIEDRMLQCIAATNYDLSQDSLPPNMPGSYLMQKFTRPIRMLPLAWEDAAALLRHRQEKAEWQMPEKLMEVLYSLSGGIPWVLEAAAEQIYDNRLKHEGKLEIQEAKDAIFDACLPVFKSWCKYLTGDQARVIRMLAEPAENSSACASRDFTGEQANVLNAAAALKNRGLLRQAEYITRSGERRKGPDYELQFNCLLFQRFCREGLAEKAAAENPFEKMRRQAAEQASREKELLQHDSTMRQLEEEEKRVRIEQARKEPSATGGDTYNIYVDQRQVISPGQLLDLLELAGDSRQLFAERLSGVLRKNFSAPALPVLSGPEELPEAALAQKMDELWDEAGRQMLQDVQVDEEQDLVDVTPAELQTLDVRFQEARNRCRPGLTDAMLEAQSERCQFYLKLSVVVEDALELPGVRMEDYSPQLVFYGKALEQALRDNLYELFHRDPELSIYNPVTHVDAPDSAEAFRNKPAGKTLMGNYEYLIAGKKERLEALCLSHPVQPQGEPAPESWKGWWEQLRRAICRAREIRNLMGHADELSPNREKLDQMCGLLLGDGAGRGILDRVTVGRQLTQLLVPREIPRQTAGQLVGTVCQMECTARKTNGGLRGITCEGGYAVNISPRMVRKFRLDTAAQGEVLVGRIFWVRILECKVQDSREFFSAELVEAF